MKVHRELDNPVFAMMIKTREGVAVFGTDSSQIGITTGIINPDQTLAVTFELENNLAPGVYYINCGLRDPFSDEAVFIHRRIDTLIFRVIADENTSAAAGVAELAAKLTIK